MNICVVSNYTKTYLYDKVADLLTKDSIQVFWIAVNQKLYQFLIKKYGITNVLLINKTHINQPQKPIQELQINELVYGDRVLSHDLAKGRQFLQNIQLPIYQFLRNNQIRFVFGETTWAHEVLIHRICKAREELACQYLDLHSVRIPYNRFAFFNQEGQQTFLEVNLTEHWQGNMVQVKKPDYLKIFDAQLKKASSISGRINRIKRFFTNENMDAEDPTLLNNFWKRLKKCSLEEWQKETYKMVKKTPYATLQNEPYVFVGLHKQPEASVEVFGRYYEDQLQNIKNLWRALPDGWKLLIKEHSNAIGDRSRAFYKSIQELPNTFLIEESIDSHTVIKQAKLVATITGTIAYEAALMGVPSVTFVPMFFNRLNRCERITLEDLNQYTLEEITNRIQKEPNNLAAFSALLHANTFEGNVIDPLTNKKVLDWINIASIAKAIRYITNPAITKKAISERNQPSNSSFVQSQNLIDCDQY